MVQNPSGENDFSGIDTGCLTRLMTDRLCGLDFTPAPAAGTAPAPRTDPGAAARSVIAEIEFPAGTPSIGPDPDLNRWKMAAVGYPLWLWIDGPHSLQASESADDLQVEIDARATRVSFDMGDGSTVTCTPAETKAWTSSTRAGAASTCGHVYQRPSRTKADPDGTYSVTATVTWTVDWAAGGATGTETVTRTGSVQLPVGELQAVITD